MKNMEKLIARYEKLIAKNKGGVFYAAELEQIRQRANEKTTEADRLLEGIYSGLRAGFMAGIDFQKRQMKKDGKPAATK